MLYVTYMTEEITVSSYDNENDDVLRMYEKKNR